MTTGLVELFTDLMMLVGLLLVVTGWWAIKYGSHRGKIADRVRDAVQIRAARTTVEEDEAESDRLIDRVTNFLAVLGDRIPFFDAKLRAQIEADLLNAGYRSANGTAVMLGVKFSFGLLMAAIVVVSGSSVPGVGQFPAFRGLAMLGAFIVGMIVPEYALRFRASSRRRWISACLPDALDLMVICTNAGNSLLVSMQRVADELVTICPPLSAEFALTADELRISGDTERALQNLGRRINLPSVRALTSTLTQSMRYGTPITQSLKTLSRSERLAFIMSLEEKAAKLAPKMVIPMMLFILPAICAIAAGPAVIQLKDFFAHQ
ncbi:type II secretion system F family protein [Burkholderia sp. Ac-20379]|uniref:type II secretion system F family protein n=1 Tax=Burkholderia sp. Ac-20379 TaxID=2703900 RepID=UPI00198171E1|nr:type II secretion system F family protein [Burkholderia sp. Ac-20379]MBN3726365.1 type II secretion system F family protein [Burkholderia sp. Ac-20379]